MARFDGLLLVAPGNFDGLLHGLLCLDGEVFKVHFGLSLGGYFGLGSVYEGTSKWGARVVFPDFLAGSD